MKGQYVAIRIICTIIFYSIAIVLVSLNLLLFDSLFYSFISCKLLFLLWWLNLMSIDLFCWYLLTFNVGLGIDFVYYGNIVELWTFLYLPFISPCSLIASSPPHLPPLYMNIYTHMCMYAQMYLFIGTVEALCISIVDFIFPSPEMATFPKLASVILGNVSFYNAG